MLRWEELEQEGVPYGRIFRVKVPGGWLVRVHQPEGEGITFYPDPNYSWDGKSLNAWK